MNKRQRKKWSKVRCPVCRKREGVWFWGKTPTGRWVSTFDWCPDCEDKKRAEANKENT